MRFLLAVCLRVFCRPRVIRSGAVWPGETFLVVANHTTFLDPILVGYSIWERDLWFLARETLFKGWRNRVLRGVHAFPVHRGGLDRVALKNVAELLRSRRSVVIFPEGTRSRDGDIGRFRSGFVKMAQNAGVRVLPVGIEGGFRVWPRHHVLPRPFRRICMTIGDPIAVDDGRSRAQLAEVIRQEVSRLSGLALADRGAVEKPDESGQVDSACKAPSPSE